MFLLIFLAPQATWGVPRCVIEHKYWKVRKYSRVPKCVRVHKHTCVHKCARAPKYIDYTDASEYPNAQESQYKCWRHPPGPSSSLWSWSCYPHSFGHNMCVYTGQLFSFVLFSSLKIVFFSHLRYRGYSFPSLYSSRFLPASPSVWIHHLSVVH